MELPTPRTVLRIAAVIFFTYNYGNTGQFWIGVVVGIYIMFFASEVRKRANP